MKNIQHKLSTALLVFIGLFCSSNVTGQVSIIMENQLVEQGEQVCMDLQVEGFDNLLTATFAVEWDPLVLDFQSTANLAPILNDGHFGTTQVADGKISFAWDDVSPRSLDDGQILFTLCFTAIGEPQEESKLRIVGTGADPGIEFVDNNGMNVGLGSAFDAFVTIQFDGVPDNALVLYYDDVIVDPGASFCVPIRVRNFETLSSLSFSIDFNPTKLRYTERTFAETLMNFWTPSPTMSTDTEIQYFGFETFTETGISMDDGTRFIEICFDQLVSDNCVSEELILSPNPQPIDAQKVLPDGSDEEVPVVFLPGKIKVRTPIDYNGSDVSPVTCNQPNIGSISVDATGGTDEIKYLWSTGATTSSISGLTAGRYDISISDVCLAVDTIFRSFEIMVDGNMPMADAGNDITLDCDVQSVTLDGSRSDDGASVVYSWRGLDGQSIISGGSADRAEVATAGNYELTAMDSNSGCSSVDTVEVFDVRVFPEVMAGDDIMLQCDDVSIELTGMGTTGVNFVHEWTTLDGNIIMPVGRSGAEIDRPGIYIFKITDAATSCFATDTVIVSGDNVTPTVGITGTSSITCDNSELTLSANTSASAGVSYSWTTLDGNIVSGADEFDVVINAPGRYEVVAENISGCTSMDAFVIIDQRTMPMAVAGDDTMIGCDDDDITLIGSGSMGPAFESNWSTSDGSIVSQTAEGQAIVNSAGTYIFTVREIDNGCATSDEVIVTGDNDRPQASISGGTTLDCNITSLNLNANNGAGAVTGLSYAWSTADGSISSGANDVLATITLAGTYTVRVTNDASGCSDNSTITVTSEAEDPMIETSADATLDCSTEIKTLTATSDNMTNMNFQWSVIEGDGQIIGAANIADIEVQGAGQYEVVVTNPLNGCSSRDTTLVELNSTLTPAEVGMDFDQCEPQTTIMGNIDGAVMGAWTVVAGNAVLENPMDADCRVNNLSNGINSFVWTLSSQECSDYSSDTINVNFIAQPIAVDDNFEVTQGFGSLEIDLLLNDQFNAETGVTLILSSEPSLGVLSETGNGQYTYTLDNPNAFGTFTFDYEICDDLCSLNCATGTATINVRDGSLPPVDPNAPDNEPQSLGITPNGDGLNDQLIFDELITNADEYTTKRLIVYNRWGDIVHEAQPYNNDWGGTDKRGGLLPQGTYYFVMQLDLGQGSIIEGDVTILQ